jgi:thiamine biosynthesis lipoprotein
MLVLLGFAAYAYVRRAPSTPAALEFSGATMGTSYRVLFGRTAAETDREGLQRGVDSVLAAVNASMSTYDERSELSRFNARTDTTPVSVSAPLAGVLTQALDVHRASGGSFDVTVGPLVDVWGFGPTPRDTTVPTASELDSIGRFVGSEKLRLTSGTLAKSDARVRVDLSAIAKGYGVDAVSDYLIGQGYANHLVEIGGELRARGVNIRGEPFRVGIEEPDPDRIQVRLAVALDNRALASSGNYRNFYEAGGVRYSHTLDPVTRRPTQHTLLAVSVMHGKCAVADAWATALMAAGPERAWQLAEANGLDVLLLIDGGGGRVTERTTPGFTAALRRNAS